MKSNILMSLLAMALTATSCGNGHDKQEKAPTRVKTEVVKSTNDGTSKPYVGIVEEREGTAVSFTSMGVVRHMLVSEGQAVSRGQLIADMDDTQARNMLAVAESTMEQANDALKRYGMLHDNGSLPEVKWVEIQSKVSQAESQLAIAKKNLADCQLRAPVSGIIGKKNLNAGETAMPSQAVVTILDISTVKVKISVPEADIKHIDNTTTSIINVEAASKQVHGGLIEKGVQADALTHTYAVRINVENTDRKLLPGMVANVQLGTAEGESVAIPTLPVTSVQKRADGSLFVWVVSSDNTAHRKAVTVGQTMGTRIAITQGIADGERVVTEGYQKLSEGTRVIDD